MRRRFVVFAATIQALLFLGHWFVYETWIYFSRSSTLHEVRVLQVTLAVLSVTFVASSVLAFRFNNWLVSAFYTLAATWMGVLNFVAIAAASCWIVYGAALLLRAPVGRPEIGRALFGLAILVSIYGILNAWRVRVKRITVQLPHLPESWRGRTAALVTDVHLGHVRGRAFMSRIIAMIQSLRPDIVFVAGDLYDGGKVGADALAAPWKSASPPFGTYFVTGNHEGFSNPSRYVNAVKGAGVRALESERVDVDGLQILGVSYADSREAGRYRAILENAGLDRERASILLLHVPQGMAITEKFGVSLQLSGHTHGGQLFPFTWFTRRVFGEYTYGLHPFGGMAVYTSCGAGTWGPPMRVGTRPEIVLIRFE
ncbi:MAG TPA: metallophosphoesterase [Verrucomicrobiae bacterium]|nr:metallophosphoesterase [Verrucomicrobiae bacterium]